MTADVDALPPTQYLALEVLAARHRLGEHLWTFPANIRPALDALANAGLIGWKGGVTAGTVRAWLTDTGRTAVLDSSYTPPNQAEVEAAALDRAAKHLEALALLDVRPGSGAYLRDRADKLRAGTGWDDAQLLAAWDEWQTADPTTPPRRTVTIRRPATADPLDDNLTGEDP